MIKNDQDELGRFVKNNRGNPTGKGGFVDNPQNINFGGRPKNSQRFGYWLQFFKDLTVEQFAEYTAKRSVKEMYMAEAIAYERVKLARKDLAEYKELADRTEGKATQSIDLSGDLTLSHLLGELTGENITQEFTENN